MAVEKMEAHVCAWTSQFLNTSSHWLFDQQKSTFDPLKDNNNPFLIGKDRFSSHSDLIESDTLLRRI